MIIHRKPGKRPNLNQFPGYIANSMSMATLVHLISNNGSAQGNRSCKGFWINYIIGSLRQCTQHVEENGMSW